MAGKIGEDISGLPKVLKIMLAQLVAKNTISGWSIYENRGGFVCMNIRFSVEDNVECVDNADSGSTQQPYTNNQTIQYRKVSPKQQARNVKRVQDFNKPMVTRSKSVVRNNDNEIEHGRDIDNICDISNENLSSVSIENCVPTVTSLCKSPALVSSPDCSYFNHSSAAVIAPLPDVSPISYPRPDIPHADQSSQTNLLPELHYHDYSTQTEPVAVQQRNSFVQCGVRLKPKSTQANLLIPRTCDSSVQVCPDVVDYAVQSDIPTTDQSDQVGIGLFQLVSSSSQAGAGVHQLVDMESQVEPDPVVAVEDTSSGVTLDLVNNVNKQSQTQFLCPGFENDPSYDPFWLNKYCSNSACRYADIGARQWRGPMYKCTLCNIVMCRSCKSETVHDEMCEDSLKFYRPCVNLY